MRMNAIIGSVALGLTSTVLVACGSGSSSSSSSGGYCDELKSDKTYFEALSGSNGDVGQLDTVFSKVHALAAKAPASVASDWKTLDDAISTIEKALAEAGLKPSDLAAMQKGQVPQGVDVTKLQALLPKLQALSDTDVSDAANKIAADAKKNCGIDLSAS
jgi:hypothetical protein